ncbi:hypothetical protein A7U60_g7625 [Sanghuangporus baumii]|uniref:Uncharacterized protein n=1 Tax=Sanghuangporus baumii TaxID=108892 RepID=A0A9Q5MZS6_SANBA|nr:hypothetical protein A7U60_g7625 [Sanghuangporus baumii]
MDADMDPTELEAQIMQDPEQAEEGLCQYEMRLIIWSIALFVSSQTIAVGGASGTMMNFIASASCLQLLVKPLGERRVALTSIAFAMIVSLCDLYFGGITVVFVCYLVTIALGAIIFCLIVANNSRATRRGSNNINIFPVTILIMRQLIENDIVLMDSDSNPTTLHNFQSGIFAASFILSTMALWLQAIGIHPLDPMLRTSYSIAIRERPRAATSILYWGGAILALAYFVISIIISSDGTPIFVKMACAAFGTHIVAGLLKNKIETKDD